MGFLVEFQREVKTASKKLRIFHVFEHSDSEVCGTSDRLVYQQLRRAGVQVVQMPLRHTWSPKRIGSLGRQFAEWKKGCCAFSWRLLWLSLQLLLRNRKSEWVFSVCFFQKIHCWNRNRNLRQFYRRQAAKRKRDWAANGPMDCTDRPAVVFGFTEVIPSDGLPGMLKSCGPSFSGSQHTSQTAQIVVWFSYSVF